MTEIIPSAGGMARQSQIFNKRMAELMAEKRGRKKVPSQHGCDVNFLSR